MDDKSRADEQRFHAAPSEETARRAIGSSLRSGEPCGRALAWTLELETWDGLSVGTQEVVGQAVGALLANEGFEFSGLEPCELGVVKRRVAVFSKGGRELSLIPGGRLALGGDKEAALKVLRDDPDVPRWLEGMGGDDIEVLIHLTPPRVVNLAPFLIEREARRLEEDDETVEEIAGLELLANFRRGGLRLPSGDEWEHACSAGSRALFRWGSRVEGCPYDGAGFRQHIAANGFGLELPWNTYDGELCNDGSVRGGDGGSAVCGGEPLAMRWLALATAYDSSDLVEDVGCLECTSQIRLARTVPLPSA